MSDEIKHECGIALIRLLKPLDFYYEKYGTHLYALNKLCLLMEKQYNRGQDGAGIACIKYDMEPGEKYLSRIRSAANSPIKDIFNSINKEISDKCGEQGSLSDPIWCKKNFRFCGELLLGHLRYGTYGKNDINACHPVKRSNNWPSKTLFLAGNFNLTNVDELFDILVNIGQHPGEKTDTVTMIEKIGHFLDDENEDLVRAYKAEGYGKCEISKLIADNIDICKILTNSCKKWDGGYVISGLIGHGDAFVIRDPAGIRPVYYYADDEIAVVSSERPPVQTAFNVDIDKIHEIKPAHALIIKKNGQITETPFMDPLPKRSCSFERIYFSRGSDSDIYKERKKLGKYLTTKVLESVNYDFENTVFSYIPNTSEVCFYGLSEEVNRICNNIKKEKIIKGKSTLSEQEINQIFSVNPRYEKIAIKDVKLRTFITSDIQRNDLVAHVYDVTYGSVRKNKDTLVAIDDSIVRGTTLKESVLKILDKLEVKKIIILSSAPQIRYPDCYGIDMAKIGDFIAFKAAIDLLKETGKQYIIDEAYKAAIAQEQLPKKKMVNCVKAIYEPFTDEQISSKIAELSSPIDINAEVEFIFQSVDDLHKACPDHKGDWYFTGNYPTPGGNKVVNRSFINFVEDRNVRAY